MTNTKKKMINKKDRLLIMILNSIWYMGGLMIVGFMTKNWLLIVLLVIWKAVSFSVSEEEEQTQ